MRRINDKIAVSEQISVSQVADIKAQDFDIVVSNRPDGEEVGQPLTKDLQKAVEDAGMEFRHIPIFSGQFTDEAVAEFRNLLQQHDRVFAYCRSGTRCAGLWALSQKAIQSADEILEQTASAGYDLSQLRAYLNK